MSTLFLSCGSTPAAVPGGAAGSADADGAGQRGDDARPGVQLFVREQYGLLGAWPSGR